jgi:hypothetical protein
MGLLRRPFFRLILVTLPPVSARDFIKIQEAKNKSSPLVLKVLIATIQISIANFHTSLILHCLQAVAEVFSEFCH